MIVGRTISLLFLIGGLFSCGTVHSSDDTLGEDTQDVREETNIDTRQALVKDFLDSVGPETFDGDEIYSLGLTPSQKEITEKCNDNAFKLLDACYQGGDIFISPLGVEYVLGMLYDAADETTSKEIGDFLSDGKAGKEELDAYFRLLTRNIPLLDKRLTFSVANAAFVDNSFKINPAYKSGAVDTFNALAAEMDFSDPAFVKEVVNQWCKIHTNEMIPELLSEDTPLSLAILLNALYFKGPWGMAVDPDNNIDAPFTSSDGSKADVTYMKSPNNILKFFSTEDFRSVLIPFGERGQFNMTVLLPGPGRSIEDIVGLMQDGGWSSMNEAMSLEHVNVTIPKFETETSKGLKEVLSGIGLGEAMSPSATYPGMLLGAERISVSDIHQKTRIKVSENGIEAAAATYSTLGTANPGDNEEPTYVDFTADHSFVYVISTEEEKIVLFSGVFEGKK